MLKMRSRRIKRRSRWSRRGWDGSSFQMFDALLVMLTLEIFAMDAKSQILGHVA
jgi:hypothetical protein